MDVKKLLSKKKNPFFQHSDAAYFIAERNGVVGRIAAIENKRHNEFHKENIGFFGFFECFDDAEVARVLFDAAANWLCDRKLTLMRGPASFSTNDECGLLVEGLDTPPTLLNPHNPAYYKQLIEGYGFEKAKDLHQFQSTKTQLPERLIKGAKLIAARKGITLRAIDMKNYDAEIGRIKNIYNSAWEMNWGFVPLTNEEIDHLAKDLKPVIVPDLVVFAEMKGEIIGFSVTLPDLNVALKKNPSGRFFPGIIKILLASRNINRVRILLLGLLPQHRKTGADALMYHWIWEKGRELGYNWGEAGWILEDNVAMANGLNRMGFETYKTLRLFDLKL